MRLRFLSCFVLLACAVASAQTAMQHHHMADSEMEYRELPPPPLMEGIGDATLTITTNSRTAQAYFNQGIRLLHCFWEFEAYRAFKEAASLDPDAAMAYWGEFEALKMSGRHGGVQAQQDAALDKAKSLAGKVSDHEQLYIRAAAFQTKDDDTANSGKYRSIMETLIDRYPDDSNARAFLALQQMGGYKTNGHPEVGEIYSQELLINLLAAHPENAAANHYWIHAVEDSSHPERALHSAEILATLAPSSGHMVHMPGHIFWRVGDYERARQYFIASMHVDEAYMAAQQIHPEEDWNYAHNLAYLVAACAETGRYQEGLQFAAKLRGMPAPIGMTASRFAIWAGGSVARLRIRFSDWKAVESEAVEFGTAPDQASLPARDFAGGLKLYAQGMDAIGQGQLKTAEAESDTLDALLWRLEASKPVKEDDDDQDEAKDQKVEDKDDDPTAVLDLVGTLSLDLRANVLSLQGKNDDARELFARVVEKEKQLGYSEPPHFYRPEQESLGDAELRAKNWDGARKAFGRALDERPKSGFALYGIAQSYALAGDEANGVKAYKDFLQSWQNADPDLPQVKKARSWLASYGQ